MGMRDQRSLEAAAALVDGRVTRMIADRRAALS
jgi:hypothetical protein